MKNEIKFDDYAFSTQEKSEFMDELKEFANATSLMGGIMANAVSVFPCPSPLETGASSYGEIQEDTLKNSRLCARYGNGEYYIRDCGVGSIAAVGAKIMGSGLGDTLTKNISDFCSGLNYFLANRRGGDNCCFVMRGGKLTAMHGSNYEYMPQDGLYEVLEEKLNSPMYGGAQFSEGYITHEITHALLLLDRREITEAYRKIRDDIGAAYKGEFACGVVFETSDVSTSAVDVRPVFVDIHTDAITTFCEGIKIPHILSKTGSGRERLEAELDKGILLTMFEDTLEKIKALGSVRINHPENTVISLCNRYGIPRKWGELARASVEGFPTLTAYDIYAFMANIVPQAKMLNASEGTLLNLETAIAKIVYADWSDHDHGGTVAWKK